MAGDIGHRMTDDAMEDGAGRPVAELQAALAQRERDIAYLTGFLDKRETFIREGMGVFATFHQRALDQQEQARVRSDAALAECHARIAGLVMQVARLEGDLGAREAAGVELRQALARQQAEIERLLIVVGQRDEAINALHRDRMRLPFARSVAAVRRRLAGVFGQR